MDTKVDSTHGRCGMEQEEPKKIKRVISPVKRFDLKDMTAKVTCYLFWCSFKALINTLYPGKNIRLNQYFRWPKSMGTGFKRSRVQ